MYSLYVLCGESDPSVRPPQVCRHPRKLTVGNRSGSLHIASQQIRSQSACESLSKTLPWSLHWMKRDLSTLAGVRSIRLTTGQRKGTWPKVPYISNKTSRSGNISIEILRKRAGLRSAGYQTWSIVEDTCWMLQNKNKVRVIRDISLLIVLSAEILAVRGTRQPDNSEF